MLNLLELFSIFFKYMLIIIIIYKFYFTIIPILWYKYISNAKNKLFYMNKIANIQFERNNSNYDVPLSQLLILAIKEKFFKLMLF